MIISRLCPSYQLLVISLSLDVEYLFWWVPVFFADGCSAVTCDLVFSWEEVSSRCSKPPPCLFSWCAAPGVDLALEAGAPLAPEVVWP